MVQVELAYTFGDLVVLFIGAVLNLIALYFVIKWAVRNAISDARQEQTPSFGNWTGEVTGKQQTN